MTDAERDRGPSGPSVESDALRHKDQCGYARTSGAHTFPCLLTRGHDGSHTTLRDENEPVDTLHVATDSAGYVVRVTNVDTAGRTEAGPEARDAARAIVERHGTSDCSCLRDEFPCEKCHMAIEDIAAALSRPAAQAAAEAMRERAAALIETAARGIRVEAGDAINDALAARLVQMVAGYADDFAAAIRALPIESARPAASPRDDEEVTTDE